MQNVSKVAQNAYNRVAYAGRGIAEAGANVAIRETKVRTPNEAIRRFEGG